MQDLIIGVHSVAHALKNPSRKIIKLYLNEDGKTSLQKKYNLQSKNFDSEVLKNHHFQEKAKEFFNSNNQNFSRIPSGLLLVCEPLEERDSVWLNTQVESKSDLKILCLDQITDIHNGAAIFRTAAFYDIDIVILPQKGSFSLTAGFFRICSGAREHIEIMRSSSFPKTIKKLMDKGVEVLALSEHAEDSQLGPASTNRVLILGAEETGISNAVLRLVESHVSIASKGEVKSLNVSVASALAMEKSFR